MSFTRLKPARVVHIQTENITALTYVLTWEDEKLRNETINQENFVMSNKKISLNYCRLNYLPTSQNVQVDWEARHVQDYNKWKLNPRLFRNLLPNEQNRCSHTYYGKPTLLQKWFLCNRNGI